MKSERISDKPPTSEATLPPLVRQLAKKFSFPFRRTNLARAKEM